MAESGDSQEKTEEPTERRLERAFEEGSLMLPQDTYALGGWIAFLASLPLAAWGASSISSSGRALKGKPALCGSRKGLRTPFKR